MATTSKSFTDVKKDLRQMFMDRGWGIEIEGETLPYYKVYTAMLDFIAEQFYGGIQKEEVKLKVTKPDIVHIENKCPKCGSGWHRYKKSTKEYKCRKCGNVYGEGKEDKILPPPKPKPDNGYYFKCGNCGKKRALYRASTKDYRCRECGYTFKVDTIKEKETTSKPKGHYYFICKNCGKRRVVYRPTTKDYRCRLCKYIFKT